MVRVGDHVRIIAIPPDVLAIADDRDEMQTKEVFRECLGRIFQVRDVRQGGELELWVHGRDDSHPEAYMESIWIEPECVEVCIE